MWWSVNFLLKMTRVMAYDKVGPHCLLLDAIQGETGHYRHCTSPSGFWTRQRNVLHLMMASPDCLQYLCPTLTSPHIPQLPPISVWVNWVSNEHSNGSTTLSTSFLIDQNVYFATLHGTSLPITTVQMKPSPNDKDYNDNNHHNNQSCIHLTPSMWPALYQWCHIILSFVNIVPGDPTLNDPPAILVSHTKRSSDLFSSSVYLFLLCIFNWTFLNSLQLFLNCQGK